MESYRCNLCDWLSPRRTLGTHLGGARAVTVPSSTGQHSRSEAPRLAQPSPAQGPLGSLQFLAVMKKASVYTYRRLRTEVFTSLARMQSLGQMVAAYFGFSSLVMAGTACAKFRFFYFIMSQAESLCVPAHPRTRERARCVCVGGEQPPMLLVTLQSFFL